MYKQFGIAVGALILRGSTVLLHHRTDCDMWDLPSGGVEAHEDIFCALRREIKEETGLRVKPGRLVGVYQNFRRKVMVFLFEVTVVSGKLTINKEADRFEYFRLDSLPHNTAPKQIERIKDYFKIKNKPVVRVQRSLASTTALGLHKRK